VYGVSALGNLTKRVFDHLGERVSHELVLGDLFDSSLTTR
jgi:hypothetical protein